MKQGYGAPVDHEALQAAWALGGIKRAMARVLQHDSAVMLVVDKVEEGAETAYQARLCTLGPDNEFHTLYDPLEGKFQFCRGGKDVWHAINELEMLCMSHI